MGDGTTPREERWDGEASARDDEGWGPVVPDAPLDEPDEAFAPGLDLAARDLAPPTLALPIDVRTLLDVVVALDDKVPYLLGGKPSSIKLTTDELLRERGRAGIDCSGFVRWLLFRASSGRVKIPDGSVNQRDRFRALADVAGVAAVPYTDCGQRDGVLRVAGFTKSARVAVGHIWLVVDGQTAESHGRHGVNRRAWDTPSLLRLCTWCYPLAALPG